MSPQSEHVQFKFLMPIGTPFTIEQLAAAAMAVHPKLNPRWMRWAASIACRTYRRKGYLVKTGLATYQTSTPPKP